MDNREENLGKVKEMTELKDRIAELEKDEAWKRSVSFRAAISILKRSKSICDAVLDAKDQSRR